MLGYFLAGVNGAGEVGGEPTDRTLLDGLITVNALHPFAFDQLLANVPMSETPVFPFLSPLFSAGASHGDYNRLLEDFRDTASFTAVMEGMRQHMWDELGMERLACYWRANLR